MGRAWTVAGPNRHSTSPCSWGGSPAGGSILFHVAPGPGPGPVGGDTDMNIPPDAATKVAAAVSVAAAAPGSAS